MSTTTCNSEESDNNAISDLLLGVKDGCAITCILSKAEYVRIVSCHVCQSDEVTKQYGKAVQSVAHLFNPNMGPPLLNPWPDWNRLSTSYLRALPAFAMYHVLLLPRTSTTFIGVATAFGSLFERVMYQIPKHLTSVQIPEAEK